MPKDLPYIVLQPESKKKYDLKIRPQVVLEALQFLKANNEAYFDIEISHENLKYYEDNNGIMKDIVNLNYAYDPSSKESLVDSEDPLNERDRVMESDLDGNFPNCDSIVASKISTDKVDQLIAKAMKQSLKIDPQETDGLQSSPPSQRSIDDNPMETDEMETDEIETDEIEAVAAEESNSRETHFAFPTKGKKPCSEFRPYWYSMAWPHLFPYGSGQGLIFCIIQQPRLWKS